MDAPSRESKTREGRAPLDLRRQQDLVCVLASVTPGKGRPDATLVLHDDADRPVPVQKLATRFGGVTAMKPAPASVTEHLSWRLEGRDADLVEPRFGIHVRRGETVTERVDLFVRDQLKIFVPVALAGTAQLQFNVSFFTATGSRLAGRWERMETIASPETAGTAPRGLLDGMLGALRRRSPADPPEAAGFERAGFFKCPVPNGSACCEVAWSASADVVLERLPVILPAYFAGHLTFDCVPFRSPVLSISAASRPGPVRQTVSVRYWKGDTVLNKGIFGFSRAEDGWLTRSRKYSHKGEPVTDEVLLPVPFGATRGEVRVELNERARLEPGPFLRLRNSMTRSHALSAEDRAATPDVIVSTTAGPYRDDVLRLRSHYMAEEFAREGSETWYVPLASNLADAARIPRLTQIPRTRFLSVVERALSADKPGIFVCSSLCDAETVLSLDSLKQRGWFVLYEARDDMEAMQGAGFSRWYAPELEQRICLGADLVTCVSDPIRERLIAFGAPPERTLTIPNGVSAADLALAEANWQDGRERRRKVGYFGHLFPGRFDVEAVRHAAEELPEVAFDIIGPGLPEPGALDCPNVTLHGRQSREVFFELAADWDIGLLPFRQNRLTHALDPIKHYQYLAAGLKVVSSDVAALRGRPMTSFYGAGQGLAAAIRTALAQRPGPADREAVLAFLRDSTWAARHQATVAAIRAAGGQA